MISEKYIFPVFSKYFRKFFSNYHKKNKKQKKTELNGCMYGFFVDYRAFDTSNVIDIHNYFMKK